MEVETRLSVNYTKTTEQKARERMMQISPEKGKNRLVLPEDLEKKIEKNL